MSEQKDTYQPIDGDLYIQEVRTGHFTIHRYSFQSWEQLGAGHSEQDIQVMTAPMQFLWESEGHRRYYRPTGRDATSTSLEARAEALEQLVRDCLLCIKDISDYNYQRPRVADLLDRAAALGIIPEVKP